MVQINFARKEINCKIVYYGPGMSGKTTNLEVVHQKTPGENKGELTCIATEGDRTLFFDFMPLNLGNIMGMNVKFQLYTVPGQVYYNSTRKLVLRGVDGVIFIADSSPDKMAENIESLENLRENLAEYGKDSNDLPIVIQYNKQDLPNALSVEEMSAQLNPEGAPAFPGVASKGEGVFATLKALSAIIIENISQKDESAPGSPPPGNTTTTHSHPSGATVGSSSESGHHEAHHGHSHHHHSDVGHPQPVGTDQPPTSQPDHQQAAALHPSHGAQAGAHPATQQVPSGSTATLEPSSKKSATAGHPHLEKNIATSPSARMHNESAPHSVGHRAGPARSKARSASSTPRTGRTKALANRSRNPRMKTRPNPAANHPQYARHRQNQPADANSKSKNKWGVVLAVVFLAAFAATTLVALFF